MLVAFQPDWEVLRERAEERVRAWLDEHKMTASFHPSGNVVEPGARGFHFDCKDSRHAIPLLLAIGLDSAGWGTELDFLRYTLERHAGEFANLPEPITKV